MPFKTLIVSLCAIAFGFASTLNGQSSDAPEQALEQTIAEVLDILHTNQDTLTLDQKRDKILTILEDRFSFEIIIRRALGRNWNQLSASQQGEINQLITDLLIRAYTRELHNGPKPKITFVRTDDLGSNKIEVFTTVTYRDNLVSVSYRMANIKSRGWQVYDVLVEGVSMVSNYRKQFDEHFQTKSADDLMELLEKKIEEYDA